jgi:hypothetical protein
MNGRKAVAPPTNWKFILGVAGSALILGIVFLKFFLLPWQQNKKAIDRAEEEFDQKSRDYRTFMKEKQRLETARLLGLPRLPNLEESSSKYTQYLKKLMKECGFPDANVDIKPTGNEEKPKSQSNQGAKKKPLHIILAFQVEAKGDWTSLTKMLEKFQRTPLLHRLRTLTVTPEKTGGGKKSPRLTINMNVEALVVNQNDKRPVNLWGVDPKLVFVDSALALWQKPVGLAWAGVLRGQALLFPEMPKRRYADLAWVNPFVGGKPRDPEEEKYLVNKKEEKKKGSPKRSEYRLVLTNPSHQRAILHSPEKDIAVKLAGPLDPSIVLTGGAAAGIVHQEEFSIFDGIDTVKGTVQRIDLREVIVEINGEVYSIGFEKTLADYLKTPLNGKDKKKPGLVDDDE